MFKTKEMNMKQIVITIVAAVMFTSTAMAQDQEKGKKKEEMIKHRTEKMVKDYNLDDKQAKQLLELNTKYADQMRPRHHGPHGGHHGMKGDCPEPPKGDCQEASKCDKKCECQKSSKCEKKCEGQKPSKEEMKAKHQERMESMKAYDAELQKILTPDQYKNYQADKEKHHKKGPRPQPKD